MSIYRNNYGVPDLYWTMIRPRKPNYLGFAQDFLNDTSEFGGLYMAADKHQHGYRSATSRSIDLFFLLRILNK
jgi:hypothetical protein